MTALRPPLETSPAFRFPTINIRAEFEVVQ